MATIIKKIVLTGFTLFGTISCNNTQKMEVTVIFRHILEEIPSASGIEILDNKIYIAGDNSPWLYQLNKKFKLEDKIEIMSVKSVVNGSIPKNVKPDFEAMASILGEKKSLLIFGSGSKSPERDVLVCMDLGQPNASRTYSLQKFYEKARTEANLNTDEFNIEAAVIDNGTLYLFNRGNNKLLIYSLKDFLNHIISEKPAPAPEVFAITLPKINGIAAGFSGATVLPETGKIVFTASVENTSNWIDDGEILGSFVGIIDLNDLQKNMIPECVMLKDHDKPLIIKAESIAVIGTAENEVFNVLLVTDSDGGNSEIIELRLLILPRLKI